MLYQELRLLVAIITQNRYLVKYLPVTSGRMTDKLGVKIFPYQCQTKYPSESLLDRAFFFFIGHSVSKIMIMLSTLTPIVICQCLHSLEYITTIMYKIFSTNLNFNVKQDKTSKVRVLLSRSLLLQPRL